VSIYPPKIHQRFARPKNAGAAEILLDADGTGSSLVCGAFVRVFLQINDESKIIEAARFKSNGCGYAIAAADALAEKIINRKLTDLHAADADFRQAEIEAELGVFPLSRRHCLEICVDALRSALSDYRARRLEEFSGEKAVICTCFGVSEETIERVVAENQVETVEEITDICKAGGGCGSCGFLIQEMIDVYWNEKY
jgi:NifU-like protein